MEAAENLDFRGAYYAFLYDGKGPTKARETIERHLQDLISLAEEMKERGFTIYTYNQKFNEQSMVPGSIRVMLSKGGETRTIYHQILSASSLQNLEDRYPNRERFKEVISRAKADIEKSLEGKQK